MFMKNFVITPQLVHKDSEDDVLLCHPRPALPLQIEISTADQWMSAGLINLLMLYRPDEQNSTLWRLAITNNHQGLTSFFAKIIPLDAAWEPYRALPFQIIDVEFSAERLKSAYADINKIDDSIAELFRSTSYQMMNQADHYFFYRKDHEHVPGIMLIEAQRQAIYAHIYTMTEHQRGEVTISLDQLHSEFYSYVDLMYPLELVVDDLQPERNLRAKKIAYRVSFFQRGKLVALIDSVVNIIEINQFKKLRNLFMYEKDNYRYAPIHVDKVHCTLIDAENKEYLAECVSLSREQCITTCDNVAIDTIRTIKVNCYGLTFSSAVKFESHAEKNVIWQFPQLNQDQLINLGGIIKREFLLQNNEENYL